MKHFVVIANAYKDRDFALTNKIVAYIEQKGGTAKGLMSNVETISDNEFELEDIPQDTQCILVLGGDGTLIRAATRVETLEIPLMGVNLGTLGYLCEVEEATVFDAIDSLMADKYMTEDRIMLTGHKRGSETSRVALNDIVIHRKDNLQILSLNVYVNGEFLNNYHADGIIVATPTGSTGYSMSAGGPIVEPTASLTVITPICSHALNTRSIVLSSDDEIVIEIGEGRRGNIEKVLVTFDGATSVPLETGDRLTICKAKESTKIMKINKISFLEILRRKMKGN